MRLEDPLNFNCQVRQLSMKHKKWLRPILYPQYLYVATLKVILKFVVGMRIFAENNGAALSCLAFLSSSLLCSLFIFP